MHNFVRRFAPLALLLIGACRSATDLGPCIGLNDEPRPDRRYEYSVRNIVVGLVFAEIIVPPVYVAFKELKCPVTTITPPPRTIEAR